MLRATIIITAAILAAGCGGAHQAAVTTTTTKAAKPKPAGLRIGVVGPLQVDVAGTHVEHGTLAQVADAPLVLVDAAADDAPTVATVAATHPSSHFALVGASAKNVRQGNLVGLVIRDEQAALLGGFVAGLVAKEEGSRAARLAWIGPQENALVAAFARGVHDALPGAIVLHSWSKDVPARCKEAALGAIERGANVVMAHGGLCADAVASAAHEQNHVALSLGNFELKAIPAAVVARDAAAGVFHGGEDLVFGATSGAIGISGLDRRISSATVLRARAAAQQLASGLPPSG